MVEKDKSHTCENRFRYSENEPSKVCHIFLKKAYILIFWHTQISKSKYNQYNQIQPLLHGPDLRNGSNFFEQRMHDTRALPRFFGRFALLQLVGLRWHELCSSPHHQSKFQQTCPENMTKRFKPRFPYVFVFLARAMLQWNRETARRHKKIENWKLKLEKTRLCRWVGEKSRPSSSVPTPS